MPERHTVEFRRTSCSIISDPERGTLSLRFDRLEGGPEPIVLLLRALRRRFGTGFGGRLTRWWAGAAIPLILAPTSRPYPDNPDLICVAATLKPGERMDGALGVVLDFFRHQPDYRRTFGPPLDRDLPIAPRSPGPADPSSRAQGILRQLLRRHAGRGRRV